VNYLNVVILPGIMSDYKLAVSYDPFFGSSQIVHQLEEIGRNISGLNPLEKTILSDSRDHHTSKNVGPYNHNGSHGPWNIFYSQPGGKTGKHNPIFRGKPNNGNNGRQPQKLYRIGKGRRGRIYAPFVRKVPYAKAIKS